MAGWLFEETRTVDDRAAFLVPRSKDKFRYARHTDRSRAHGAGLEGDIEVSTSQTVVLPGRGSGADGDNLRMGGGVISGNRAVSALTDDSISFGIEYDGPDRNFTPAGGLVSQFHCALHGRGL